MLFFGFVFDYGSDFSSFFEFDEEEIKLEGCFVNFGGNKNSDNELKEFQMLFLLLMLEFKIDFVFNMKELN